MSFIDKNLYAGWRPEVTANINCKSRNLPDADTQITVQICGNFRGTQYKYYIIFGKSRDVIFCVADPYIILEISGSIFLFDPWS